MSHTPNYRAHLKIANCNAFRNDTGSLWAETIGAGRLPRLIGWLPVRWAAVLEEVTRAHGAYIVYSYGTPIAWRSGERWTIPDVKYSRTTSRHQGIARRAAGHGYVAYISQDVAA